MANPQTFGEILRAGRRSQGISATQLAEQLDRSKASIRSWERNESEPPPEDVERLIELLDLDRSALDEAEATNRALPAGLFDEPSGDGHGGPVETSDESAGTGEDAVVSPQEDEPQDADQEPADDGAADAGAENRDEVEVEVDAEADTVAHPMLPLPASGRADAEPHDSERSGRAHAEVTSSTSTSTSTSSSSLPVAAPRKGFFATIRDPEKPWLGYIRAFLTIVVLAALGWAFLWAVRELLAAVGDLRGSDPDVVQAVALMVFLRTPAR